MAMDSGRWILFISYILTTIFACLTLTHAQQAPGRFQASYCNYAYTSNYTSNSVFRRNLDNLTSTISSLPAARFYNFSIGRNPDRVYVIALCRGDVAMDACGRCLTEANTKLRNLCRNEKQSIGWDDNCMLRYWDQPIVNIWQTLPNAYTNNPESVPNAFSGQFNQAVRSLLRDLLGVASVRKFATGSIRIGPHDNMTMTIYGLAECTPDLSRQDCSDCLNGTHEKLPECCDGKIGGRVLYPSCNFRYEIGQFYSTNPNETTSDGGPLPGSSDATHPQTPVTGTRYIIVIVISIIIFLVLVISCVWIIMRKRKQKMWNLLIEGGISMVVSIEESLQFDFDTIKVATDGFSDTNKLGQGCFGAVYKGMLPNGRDVAVKRLSQTSHQGEVEFKTEVFLMANLLHRNLVRLLGFCLQGTERLLIYEFIPNASLDHFIFDPKKRGHLDGDMRYKIIVGIARGLLYLHEDSRVQIIHLGLKASNILLDAEMNPKIADFGMARIFYLDENENQASTQRIVGTYGYMAPEYAMFGHFSIKSDVYSFGVLVLEIVSGQKNTQRFENEDSVEYLLSHAWKNWNEGTHSKFIDPILLDGSSSMSDILRCIHIGLLCVQDKAVDRPTMASVVIMFINLSLTLQMPTEPEFFRIDPQRSEVIVRKRKQKKEINLLSENECEISMEISSVKPLRYDFDTVKFATDDFSDTNKLGQGGFGAVYKGTLPNRRVVAVKRLSQTSHQGSVKFKNEVLLVAKLRHRNLVSLLGFCLQGTERILIYEFIHNASLDHFIFDSVKPEYLNWSMLYKIIEGIARGLFYLHEVSRKRKIHRNLKASNILLDAEMNPKIADFGMARMFGLEETHSITNRIEGTYGYMAPEYAMFGQFSVKSDVFSFGVLVLEIISGKKNNHGVGNEENSEYLLSHAWKNWKEGTHSKFIDPTLLHDSSSMSDIMRCIHIGLLCVQEKPVDRPTMASVVNMLSSMSLTPQIPTEPAIFINDPQSSQVTFKSKDSVIEASNYRPTIAV